jgi:hypothetical protein
VGVRTWPLQGLPRFKIARWSDNELVPFDEARRESWLLYPPRSRYEFLRRPTRDSTMVVCHPWAPYSMKEEHAIRVQTGCGEPGLACEAREAVQAAIETGFDPFR